MHDPDSPSRETTNPPAGGESSTTRPPESAGSQGTQGADVKPTKPPDGPPNKLILGTEIGHRDRDGKNPFD